ncbi:MULTISPECIES: glycosyltransferase [Pseudomonas]|nr:glycosyltransferase [Pseudomonas azotoformans]
MFKVTHLTSVHNRSDIRIFHKECISLKSAGYDVSLIVADGLGFATVHGVEIHDVGAPAGRVGRMLKSTNLIYQKAVALDSDLYHFHDPELIPVGVRLKKLGKKVIYDIHEDVPTQLLHKKYIYKPLRPILSALFKTYQRFACSRFDALIVPQPTMVVNYEKIAGTVLIENFSFVNLDQPVKLNLDNICIFHGGAITVDRGLFNMLSLAEQLRKDDKFYLAGKIEPGLLAQAEQHPGWEKITYLGVIPVEEVSKYYSISNLGVILYNNVDQYNLSYAIKLFEYMSFGMPVLMPDFGEWVGFNQENNCGLNVEVDNQQSVVKALDFIRDNASVHLDMGQNGYVAVREKYNWAVAEDKLISLYKELLSAQ